LVLGGVFADGYLAAQAEDAQQCKNISKDLLRLSKTLGVQTELLDRSRSIADSAQKKDWAILRRELHASEEELGAALRKHEDEGLARLVSLGAWMRSTEIVASLLNDHYSENAASLLRQPALGALLGSGLENLCKLTNHHACRIRQRIGLIPSSVAPLTMAEIQKFHNSLALFRRWERARTEV
jgi:hypothetical protein